MFFDVSIPVKKIERKKGLINFVAEYVLDNTVMGINIEIKNNLHSFTHTNSDGVLKQNGLGMWNSEGLGKNLIK